MNAASLIIISMAWFTIVLALLNILNMMYLMSSKIPQNPFSGVSSKPALYNGLWAYRELYARELCKCAIPEV